MSVWASGPATAGGADNGREGRVVGPAQVERTEVELNRLQTLHEAWGDDPRAKPEAERYKTQLDAIDALVQNSADRLRAGLEAPDLSASDGAIYEACRIFDLRIPWLRRVWLFFREKFDQRDTGLADVLWAADEIVWSCYHQVFERAKRVALELKAGAPAPPFIGSRYSPSTFPADLVPYRASERDRQGTPPRKSEPPAGASGAVAANVRQGSVVACVRGHEVGHAGEPSTWPAPTPGHQALALARIGQGARIRTAT